MPDEFCPSETAHSIAPDGTTYHPHGPDDPCDLLLPGGYALSVIGPGELVDTWSHRWGTDWAPMAERDIDMASALVALMRHPGEAHSSRDGARGTYPDYTMVPGSAHIWCAVCGELVGAHAEVVQDAISWTPAPDDPGWWQR
jgi:hypothetical protein